MGQAPTTLILKMRNGAPADKAHFRSVTTTRAATSSALSAPDPSTCPEWWSSRACAQYIAHTLARACTASPSAPTGLTRPAPFPPGSASGARLPPASTHRLLACLSPSFQQGSARDREMRTSVAIKVLRPACPDIQARFAKEVLLLRTSTTCMSPTRWHFASPAAGCRLPLRSRRLRRSTIRSYACCRSRFL